MNNSVFPNYDLVKIYYDWGIPQDYDWYCKIGSITPAQYKKFTGKDYVAPTN